MRKTSKTELFNQTIVPRLCMLGLLIAIHTGCTPAAAVNKVAVAGNWLGTLKAPGVELRTGFTVEKKTDGTLAGTMSSIDQGAINIPMDEVTLTNNHLRLTLKAMGASYEGDVEPDGRAIRGRWKQGPGELPLALEKVDQLPELRRPQNPVKPYAYQEEEVRYENKKAGIVLAGTLTLPRAAGPFPAVILLTGSGPQNRDEEMFGHKPFLVMADYLTRRGFAVLRADDRGVGASTGDFSAATTGDFANDALAGVAFLKTRKEIDPKSIGLIGHSEGGMMAPIAAAQSRDVAFIVMMAGTGVPFGEVVAGQIAKELQTQGAPDQVVSAIRAWHLKMYGILAKATDNATAEKELRSSFSAMDDNARQKINWTSETLEHELPGLLKPWWRYAMQYSPKSTLAKVTCPVLALNGAKDTQVIADDNLKSIAEALKAGRNSHYKTLELPGLNHLFQTATTGAESEYVHIEETLSPVAMQTMADWMLQLAAATK